MGIKRRQQYRGTDSRRFHYDSDTLGFDRFLYSYRNLASKSFLDLQTPTESLGNASKFGYPKNQFVGNVSYRDLVAV